MSRGALVGFALLLVAGSARANGRFPSADQLLVDPRDATRLVLRTTFGIAQSTDGGATWRWICEERIGFKGAFDPALVIARDGAVLAGLPDGLSRTTDRGCTTTRVAGAVDRQYMIDLAADATRVVAVSSPLDRSKPGFQALLASSTDHGVTWSGSLLPEDFTPQTIDLAPSRPQRWYASGVGAFTAFASVLRSDDFGATFAESTFDMGGARAPYIAAIDPRDPDRVFLRLDGDTRDRLLLSRDGGVRFEEVHALGELLGFALSPDGSRVAIGGPTDGLWVAGADLKFAKVSATPIRCLTWTAAGLYACSSDGPGGFAIGLSTDEGRTFAPRLKLSQLAPLECVRSACAAAWRDVSATIGEPVDAGVDAGATAAMPLSASGGGCGVGSGGVFAAPLVLALVLLGRARRHSGGAGCPSSRRRVPSS